MRWEDERYVKVYTRDTGDWLALSFEGQALFLMVLRKLDRIGELRLGKRGKRAIGACVGHPGVASLDRALDELLADGCVRLNASGDVLFVPNFLKAQEVSKSPAERKREQRERDVAQALEKTQLSRDVTPVTFGHEMSPLAVPSLAVPSLPSRAVPIEETYAGEAPARPEPESELPGQEELIPGPGVVDLQRAWNANTTAPLPKWERTPKSRRRAAQAGLKRRPVDGPEGWATVFRRIEASAFCRGATGWVADIDWALRPDGKKPETAAKVLEGTYDNRATGPPRGGDPRKAPVRAEDVHPGAFEKVGDVSHEF